MLEETGFAGEELNHLYGYVSQNPYFWTDPYGLAKNKNKGKFVNPNRNPNKKKGGGSGTGTKKGDGGRQRNVGHDNAEEHNRSNTGKRGGTGRGGKGLRGPFPVVPCFLIVHPYKACNTCDPSCFSDPSC